jgi:uncharacterized protein YjiS (DUF1127 family)
LQGALTDSAVDGASPAGWAAAAQSRFDSLTSPPSLADAGVPRPAARGALSWLKEFIIEGLAAYGHALYPCLVEPGESVDRHDQAEVWQRSHRTSRQDHEAVFHPSELPFCFEDHATVRHLTAERGEYQFVQSGRSAPEDPVRPEIQRNCFRSWKTTFASAVFRFWSRMRQKQKLGAMIRGLEALDDRTLKDIGIPRGQIRFAVSQARQEE